MSDQNLLDEQLVERVQRGDKNAFNLLVKNTSTRWSTWWPGMSTTRAMYRMWRRRHSSRPTVRCRHSESAFYTWLYRIAVNTAKNYLTSQGRRPPSSDVEAEEAEYYGGGEALQEVATPENLTLTDEIKRTVFSAIEALPEDLRTAITLRELEGLSYEEIAEIMDCPVGTVRSRIFRAREAIDKSCNL